MFEEERKIQILNMLNRSGSVAIQDLVEFFQVSASTIRRDLTSLEHSGMVKRTHGGAMLLESAERAYNFKEKQARDQDLKSAIGKLAASLVEDGDIIAVNSSTITTEMVRYLTARRLTVVTNSLNILNIVKDYPDYQIIVLGGIYMNTAQTIEGPTTTEQIRGLQFDKAFLGANGVDAQFGVSSAGELETRGKIAMLRQARKNYFLCEHAKFDKPSLFRIAELSAVTALITDAGIAPETLARYRESVEVIVADL